MNVLARCCLVLTCSIGWLGAGSLTAPQDPERLTAPFPRVGEYVGKPACAECHRDEASSLARSAHAGVADSDALAGCETCHGPGHAHAEHADNDPLTITFPPLLDGAAQLALCGRCHGPEVDGHGGDLAGFLATGRGCTECHEVHQAPSEPRHAGLRYLSKEACDAANAPVGGALCVSCHPRLDTWLADGAHRSLASSGDRPADCELCHGAGEQHAESSGLARLITRPDRARDGVATCRGCHAEVDARTFHWDDAEHPLLAPGLTCTSCHLVHGPDPATVEPTTQHPSNRLCVTCHAPAFDVLHGTIHEALGGLDVALDQGCGSCHAGAAEHARHGGRRELVESLRGSNAATQRAVCMQCHDGDATLQHVGIGSHHRADVSCLSCHSPAEPAATVRDTAAARCASCHPGVMAEFALPNHHPLRDVGGGGQMTCVDCHEPHGARPKLRDAELRERRCIECHVEYRGPFVFEHHASRHDGCTACHTPHGSSNRRLLDTATVQQSCLACHGDLPSFHDQSPGSIYRECLSCHTEVHGSQHSRFFLR